MRAIRLNEKKVTKGGCTADRHHKRQFKVSMRQTGRARAHDGFSRAFPALEAMIGGGNSTDLPVVVADALAFDLPVIDVNAALTTLTGYTADEVLGRNCRFLQGKDTDSPPVARLRGAIAAGLPIAIDILNDRKDGTTFSNALSMAAVNDDIGRPRFYFSCQLDTSDRRETSSSLRQKAHELEDDLAAKAQALLLNEIITALLRAMPPGIAGRRMPVNISKSDRWIRVSLTADRQGVGDIREWLHFVGQSFIEALIRQVRATIVLPPSDQSTIVEIHIPTGAQ